MIRILIADDRDFVQQSIKSLLEPEPNIKVVGTAKDGRAAIIQLEELRPDIVLLDIEMPGMDGITATKYITHLAPQIKVIILSSHEDKKYLTQALVAGAKAYILKNSLAKDLKQSIIAVNNGYSHIESRLLAKVFDPSNLKLNRKKTAQNRQAKIATQKLESTSAIKVARTENSQLVSVDVSPQTIHPASTITSSKKINSTTVPKINLPDSNLENADDLLAIAPARQIETSFTPNKLLPSATVHNSTPQLSVAVEQCSNKLVLTGKTRKLRLKVLSAIAKSQPELVRWWRAKMLQYQPLIARYRQQLIYYQTKLIPLLKHWYEKGWLANLGLAVLGLITVIIISLMFA